MTDTTDTGIAISSAVWRQVDVLSGYTTHPTNSLQWAQYADRLRCALAEQLVATSASHDAVRLLLSEAREQLNDTSATNISPAWRADLRRLVARIDALLGEGGAG